MIYSIRPMDKDDLGQVSVIDHEAFPTQWPPANYRQELQNKLAHYLVACDGARMTEPSTARPQGAFTRFWSRLTGRQAETVGVTPPQNYIAGFSGIWMMVDEAHITNIAVRQEYRGKGIGGLLLIATIDLATECKASFLTLEVRASNLTAQKLYNRYGFMQTGRRKGYYLDNREDALIMSTEGITMPSFQARVKELRESLAAKLNHA